MNKDKKKKLLFTLATKLTWLVILFFGKISRVKLVNRKYWNQLIAGNKGFIIVTWHGKMLLPIYLHRDHALIVMVSEHRDGEMISRTIHRLGYRTIRGSSTRGGSNAYRQMIRALRQNEICVVLPDGPTGPRHEFKMGAVQLAQRSGLPLLPMTFSAAKPITLKSWDRFILWKPFTKIAMIYGPPIFIPKTSSDKEQQQTLKRVQQEMNKLERTADAFFQ